MFCILLLKTIVIIIIILPEVWHWLIYNYIFTKIITTLLFKTNFSTMCHIQSPVALWMLLFRVFWGWVGGGGGGGGLGVWNFYAGSLAPYEFLMTHHWCHLLHMLLLFDAIS